MYFLRRDRKGLDLDVGEKLGGVEVEEAVLGYYVGKTYFQ